MKKGKRDEIQVFKDDIGDWRWKLVGKNGTELATAVRGYPRKDRLLKTLGSIKKIMKPAIISVQG